MNIGASHAAASIILLAVALALADGDVAYPPTNATQAAPAGRKDGGAYVANEIPEPQTLPVLHINGTKCRISEYQCTNKRCVPINRYCDGGNDCGDSSDEPRHCTPMASVSGEDSSYNE
ncbi:Low-density lipoprotein receptor-related protein 8 [Eumeta japonica]|uniref:Low-density lipoprotein receptor-related protein 8 n=1 Tax=Eumeta variegata TaxID=151549 RepID=A0A4C1YP28_EUMVA|nr:Low-density lipoprotein receptor-related protein 8 [Eumeta japonica]